jgi:hypothetical protein
MKAKAALWMISISNLAFGIHFSLWKLGFTPKAHVGIDPFAGYLAVWFSLFCVLTVIETVAIVRGYIADGWKGSAAATALLVLQIGAMYFQYWMVQGV